MMLRLFMIGLGLAAALRPEHSLESGVEGESKGESKETRESVCCCWNPARESWVDTSQFTAKTCPKKPYYACLNRGNTKVQYPVLSCSKNQKVFCDTFIYKCWGSVGPW